MVIPAFVIKYTLFFNAFPKGNFKDNLIRTLDYYTTLLLLLRWWLSYQERLKKARTPLFRKERAEQKYDGDLKNHEGPGQNEHGTVIHLVPGY